LAAHPTLTGSPLIATLLVALLVALLVPLRVALSVPLTSLGYVLPDTDVERVLAIFAHPDDVDFSAAGSIAMWTKAGIEVSYCMVTNGDAGGFDPSVTRTEIAGIRQAEQRAAAGVVGVSDVTFLGYPDGRLEVTLDLRRDISGVIRRVRPQRVITSHPLRNLSRIYASHPDHIAAGEAVLSAVYPDARNPFAHPSLLEDGLEAWSVSEVWTSGGETPNHYVDVTDVYDTKVSALLAHESQMPGVDDLHNLLRGWMGSQAATAGMPQGRLAEAFQVIDTAG
jgi:LmbE family N-acetylglucosaminyl deacetylase